jgi:glutamine amidotransferase
MISIIDVGMGNIGSIVNLLKHIGVKSKVIHSASELRLAEKLILPGVGSWDNGIKKLMDSGLISELNEAVLNNKTPVLGICLGMQLMLESSEEGVLPGLSWIEGKVRKFNFSESLNENKNLRIPHMGWNVVSINSKNALIDKPEEEKRFYFVHSYHATEVPENNAILACQYGYPFVCGVHKQNIWGVQFHPEKSHKFGMNLMRNFAAV